MATVIYPPQNNGLSQIASIVNMIRGFQQLSEQKRQSDLSRGQNVDDIRFQNTQSDVANMLADQAQRKLGTPPIRPSPIQQRIARQSPGEIAGQTAYRKEHDFQTSLGQNRLTPEEQSIINVPSGDLPSDQLARQRSVIDKAIKIDEARQNFKSPEDSDVIAAAEKRARKLTGKEQSREIEEYDRAMEGISALRKQNVKEFTGNAQDLYDQNRALTSSIIEYGVKNNDKKIVANAYKAYLDKVASINNVFKWNKQEMPLKDFLGRLEGGKKGSVKSTSITVSGTEYFIPVSETTSNPKILKNIWFQQLTPDERSAYTGFNDFYARNKNDIRVPKKEGIKDLQREKLIEKHTKLDSETINDIQEARQKLRGRRADDAWLWDSDVEDLRKLDKNEEVYVDPSGIIRLSADLDLSKYKKVGFNLVHKRLGTLLKRYNRSN